MADETTVTIRCDKETKFRLQVLSAHTGSSDQEALRQAVEEVYKRRLPEIRQRLGWGPMVLPMPADYPELARRSG